MQVLLKVRPASNPTPPSFRCPPFRHWPPHPPWDQTSSGRLVFTLGPFGDQPLLARRGRCGLLLIPSPARTRKKQKRGCHRLTVGAVSERHRLPHRSSWRGDQRADRLGLAIWPGPFFPAALASLTRLGHLEDRLWREHRRVRRDAQHVLVVRRRQAERAARSYRHTRSPPAPAPHEHASPPRARSAPPPAPAWS